MTNLEILLPPGLATDDAERAIEAAIAGTGLEISLRGTLKQFPGCIHWHAQMAGRSGTLELTLWPAKSRAWISQQSGRLAPWIAEKLPALEEELRIQLQKR